MVAAAILLAFAVAPSTAAAVAGSTSVSLPPVVTVGQTGVITKITLTNQNVDPDTNTVCDAGDGFPCDGSSIMLLPACGLLSGLDDCFPGREDPGVFTASPVASGAAGACNGMTFDVIGPDPVTGALRISPQGEGSVLLPIANPVCTIDVTLAVAGMPAEDEDALIGGVQTRQIASATQASGSDAVADAGTSQTTVIPARPAIATTASGDITLGGTITDTATVSGRVNPTGGAVQFRLFGPGDTVCATPISTTSSPLSAAGTATSPPFTPSQTGTYRWIAAYGGDDNNAPVSGACNDPGESVTVTAAPPPPRVTPAIAIAASPGIVAGGTISATANVASPANPAADASVLFRLFAPADAGCAGAPAFAATVAVSAAGSATSPPFTPPALGTGTYRWTASYSGNAFNVPVATTCNAPGSTVAVAPLAARIVSAGFGSAPRVGQPAFLTVSAVDPARPISGLQVQFGEPSALSGVSACRSIGFGFGASPVLLRLPYTFRRAGRHRVTIIVLSGGCTGRLTLQTTTIEVVVGTSQAARGAFAAAGAEPGARAAQSGVCKNTLLRPTSSAVSRVKVATAILCLVNVERRKKALKRLQRSTVLARAASGHSRDMLKRRYFEHSGPGGPSLRIRLRRVRYRGSTSAENIAYGSNFNARLVMQAWMNSPPHKANILGRTLRFLGVGIAVGIPVTPGRPGSTYTQDFGSTLK